MHNAKHSPGPWVEQCTGEIVSADGSCVCDINLYGGSSEITEANTALVCAAPELADALEAVREWSIGNGVLPPRWTPVKVVMESALRSAGRLPVEAAEKAVEP